MKSPCISIRHITALLLGLGLSLGLLTPVHAADPYEISLDIRVETDSSAPVMPRENVPYKLFVENNGGEAWIRVHALTSAVNTDDSFTTANLHTANGWIRRGNYLYLTRKAAPASSILAVNGFTVPDIDISYNASLSISVRAEAIDIRSVTPDFELDDPWKGQNPDTITEYNKSDSSSGNTDSDRNNGGSSGSGSQGGSGNSHNGSGNSGSSNISGGSNSSGGSGSGNRSSSGGGSASSGSFNRYSKPTINAAASSGTWYCIDSDNNLWQYRFDNGSIAKDGWYLIFNKYASEVGATQWFYFNSSGLMQTGWAMMNSSEWYHLHEISDGSLGALSTGWYTDTQDNKRYYLDGSTGLMQVGWKTIGDKSYYFTNLSDIPGPSWVYTLISGTTFGRWLYNRLSSHSYGSLYINESTPDGSIVDSAGAKVSQK